MHSIILVLFDFTSNFFYIESFLFSDSINRGLSNIPFKQLRTCPFRCRICQLTTPEWKTAASQVPEVLFADVNADTETTIKRAFSVDAFPTVIALDYGYHLVLIQRFFLLHLLFYQLNLLPNM